MTTYEFRCNGEWIFVTVDRGGQMHLDESGGEQCEGCGADILESGRARLFNERDLPLRGEGRAATWGTVTCGHCAARYELAPASERF